MSVTASGSAMASVDLATSPHRTFALIVGFALLGMALVGVVVTAPPRIDDAVQGQRVAVDAGRDFSPQEQAVGDSLAASVRPWALANQAVGLLVALMLGLTPLGARIVRAISEQVGGGPWWSLVLGTLVLLLIGRLVTLPFVVMARRPQVDVGLSTQAWSAWLVDVGKSFLITSAVVVIAVVALRALALASPGWWWAWAALGAGAAVVVMSFLVPVVVEPVFNRFTPMPDGAPRTSLLELASDEGVGVDEVLVADASRRTTALNAYVSGLGTSRRIVVYDNLIADASPAEVRSVVAHELGHAAEHDVRDATAWGAIAAAGAVALLGFLLAWQPLLRRADVGSVTDPAVVGLVLAIVALLSFLVAPASNAVSRRVEARADVRALDATKDPLALAQVQRRLALTNKSDVTPPANLYAWFGTHPTAPQRIGLARAWSRANDGGPVPDLAGTPLAAAPGRP